MKKYLILLIIPLLFSSTGCEEDENLSEISTVVTETLSLDPELFGVWKECSYTGLENNCYYGFDYWSFSSNGQYSHFIDYLAAPNYPLGQGNWYV